MKQLTKAPPRKKAEYVSGPCQAMTQEECAAFLFAYSTMGNMTKAATVAGVTYQRIANRRKTDPVFADAFAEAKELAIDMLEDEARRRGHDGIDKKIFHQGLCVDIVKEYSDGLLKFLLQSLRRDVFGVKQEITLPAVDTPPERVKDEDSRAKLLKLVSTGKGRPE